MQGEDWMSHIREHYQDVQLFCGLPEPGTFHPAPPQHHAMSEAAAAPSPCVCTDSCVTSQLSCPCTQPAWTVFTYLCKSSKHPEQPLSFSCGRGHIAPMPWCVCRAGVRSLKSQLDESLAVNPSVPMSHWQWGVCMPVGCGCWDTWLCRTWHPPGRDIPLPLPW